MRHDVRLRHGGEARVRRVGQVRSLQWARLGHLALRQGGGERAADRLMVNGKTGRGWRRGWVLLTHHKAASAAARSDFIFADALFDSATESKAKLRDDLAAAPFTRHDSMPSIYMSIRIQPHFLHHFLELASQPPRAATQRLVFEQWRPQLQSHSERPRRLQP